MSRQYDSLAFSDDKQKCIITCMCGEVAHGALMINRDEEDKEFYLSFCVSPWEYKFFGRIKNAIKAFRNQPIEVDLFVTEDDAAKLAGWLKGNKFGRFVYE